MFPVLSFAPCFARASGALVLAVSLSLGACASDDGITEQAPLGVNAYLWQASLETIAFMPLISTDPLGGVIVTDWFSPPATPLERFKLTVQIQGKRLRADGASVAVIRERRASGGAAWRTTTTAGETKTKIENAILTRARELRIAAVARQ